MLEDVMYKKFPKLDEEKIWGGAEKVDDKIQGDNKIFGQTWKRLQEQRSLSLFGDKDKDKIPNIIDRQPNKKSKMFFNLKGKI